ncbi:hypothetical protein L7F22_041437 [Adiantum nelumboides]|nr:hypothetical protein [Adiantum nelumboides]
MSYESFNALLDIVEPLLPCSGDLFFRAPVASDLALACVLWRLAHGHSSKSMTCLSPIGESTIWNYTMIICHILSQHNMLARFHICIPEGATLKSIMDGFEAITGLPQVAGAIDGTHIRLQRKPSKDKFSAQYVCRHGFPSILLQGIVDSHKLVWSVVCVAPGSSHDSTHFKGSSLYQRLKSGRAIASPTIQLQGESIRPYLIADSTYKATTFLVKPFRSKGGQHLIQKQHFDRHLSKGRVKVENAFGILKNRWRILRELNVDLALAPTVIGACCLLHNFV